MKKYQYHARDLQPRLETIKLYFMIGHPSETLEDVQAIVDLCKRVIEEGRKVAGWKVKLHAGVSTFVPKPQTPFQWVACDTRDNILEKQALLKRQLLKDKSIKLSWTKPEDSLLEAWLSRGDRRMSEVIYSAWKNGAKFDAWDEAKNRKPGCLRLKNMVLTLRFTHTASAARTKSFRGNTSRLQCARISCFRISGNRSKAKSAWTAV